MTSSPPRSTKTRIYESHVLLLTRPKAMAVKNVSAKIMSPISKGWLAAGNKSTNKDIRIKRKKCLITKSSLVKNKSFGSFRRRFLSF